MDEAIRILCVDDDALLLSSLKRLLARAGFEVETATGGHEALSRLEAFDPHVLLSDLQMPEMSGEELLTEVSVRYPSIRRVLLTGSSLPDTAAKMEQGRVCELMLRKPFDANIVDRLKELLTRK